MWILLDVSSSKDEQMAAAAAGAVIDTMYGLVVHSRVIYVIQHVIHHVVYLHVVYHCIVSRVT